MITLGTSLKDSATHIPILEMGKLRLKVINKLLKDCAAGLWARFAARPVISLLRNCGFSQPAWSQLLVSCCDLREGTSLLCASVSFSLKWG